MAWTPTWSPAELRLIAKGEAAADEPGVIPAEFVGPERAAWRAGYGRGWAGLCTVSRVDPPEHLPVKAAWSAGWTTGSETCKKAGVGFDPFVLPSGRSFGDRKAWSQDECDAFDVGYKLGRETENEHKALLFRPRIYWGLLGQLFHFFDRGNSADSMPAEKP